MTKDYHLTQEQALELVNKVHPECKYAGSLELYPQSLTNIINAALDKVLGEPIYATETPGGFMELDANEYDAETDVILYAPKEMT